MEGDCLRKYYILYCLRAGCGTMVVFIIIIFFVHSFTERAAAAVGFQVSVHERCRSRPFRERYPCRCRPLFAGPVAAATRPGPRSRSRRRARSSAAAVVCAVKYC